MYHRYPTSVHLEMRDSQANREILLAVPVNNSIDSCVSSEAVNTDFNHYVAPL